jgi:hypothetical protein
MVAYTLDNYMSIIFDGINYKLPDNVIANIKKLSLDLNINTDAIQKPIINTDSKYKAVRTKTNNNRSKPADDSWDKVRSFKTTTIEKKEGVEKVLNDIRICLNKLSESNYDVQRNLMCDHINELTTNSQALSQIASALFEIASANKFYSEIYALLYKELAEKYPIFNEIISIYVTKYMENVNQIKNVTAEEDYNLFCDNNKENDKRKAMSAFIVNLMKVGLISKDDLFNIILSLEDHVINLIDTENKLYEVEEISENIFILITTVITSITKRGKDKKCCDVLNNVIINLEYKPQNAFELEKWQTSLNNIIQCSKCKVKEHPSISSRTLFRYMDILDSIRKST